MTAPDSARTRFLHLFALAGLAIAAPLLDLLGRHASFLVAHRAGAGAIAALLVALLAAPPLLLFALERAVSQVSARAGARLHLASVALLVTLIALPLIERVVGLPALVVVAAALAGGVLASALYARHRPVQVFASVLALGPLVFAGVFASTDPVSRWLAGGRGLATPPVNITSDAPVVVVVFDELPTTSLLDASDGIDAVRYPAFARLARNATWFRSASAVHALTEHALPAILTGRDPVPGRLPTAIDHPQNLFSLFDGAYDLHVVEPFTSLHAAAPSDGGSFASLLRDLGAIYLHIVLPDALAAALPAVDATWASFTRGPAVVARDNPGAAFRNRPDRFRAFVAAIRAGDRPTLHFAHVPLPHAPMQYLPSGRAYYPPHDFGLVDNFWTAEPWWVIQGYQRHLLQLALADRLLGELLDRLEAEGLYDAALVIVAADHGASFWPGQSRRNPSDMEHPEDVLAVPLLVKTPGQREGRRSLRDVTTLDILPTIADALGIAIPWEIDGCSALDEACPARAHRVMSDRDDAVLTFPNDLPLRRASLERKLEIFGAGSSNARLFRVGPYRDLVGRRVATLAVAGPAPERAHLMRRPFVLAQERPEQFALARITGTLQVHGENAPHVAVAVDGTIRAVVPALPSAGGGLFFSALVDEATAPRSRAGLALYTVRGPADAPQLRRMESVFAEFRVLPRAALPDAD